MRLIPMLLSLGIAACSLGFDPDLTGQTPSGGGGPGAGGGGGAAGAGGQPGALGGRAGGGGSPGLGGAGAAGTGVGGGPAGGPCKTSAECDDANPCTTDVCFENVCKRNPALPGTECDNDQDRCNGFGLCKGSVCERKAETAAKLDDGSLCTVDACDPKTGAVTHTEKVKPTDSTKCLIVTCNLATGKVEQTNLVDDQNPCTIDECDVAAGAVHTAKPVADGDPCTKDSCNAQGVIVHEPIADCEPCSVEKEATEKLCGDGNPCTVETCTPCVGAGCKGGVCSTEILKDGTNVDDGNLCNGVDTCVNGKSIQTTPPPNKDDKNVCTLDECDPKTGKVTHPPVPGLDDKKQCTQNLCDPVTGASFPPVDVADTNPCTTNERCQEGIGLTSTPIPGCTNTCKAQTDCQLPGRPCLEFKCEGGICTETPRPANTKECTDQNEACATFECVQGECTKAFKTDSTGCDDNTSACDGTASCVQGKCVPVSPVVVPPRQRCQVSTCSEPAGNIVEVPVSDPTCQTCTTGADCNVPPAPFDVKCTAGSCNAINECEYAAKLTTTACGNPAACSTQSCKSDGTCGSPVPKTDCCSNAADCAATGCFPSPVCVLGWGAEGTCAQGAIKPCPDTCRDGVTVQRHTCTGAADCTSQASATSTVACTTGNICTGGACGACTSGVEPKCPSGACGTNGVCCPPAPPLCGGNDDCRAAPNGCPLCRCSAVAPSCNQTNGKCQ